MGQALHIARADSMHSEAGEGARAQLGQLMRLSENNRQTAQRLRDAAVASSRAPCEAYDGTASGSAGPAGGSGSATCPEGDGGARRDGSGPLPPPDWPGRPPRDGSGSVAPPDSSSSDSSDSSDDGDPEAAKAAYVVVIDDHQAEKELASLMDQPNWLHLSACTTARPPLPPDAQRPHLCGVQLVSSVRRVSLTSATPLGGTAVSLTGPALSALLHDMLFAIGFRLRRLGNPMLTGLKTFLHMPEDNVLQVLPQLLSIPCPVPSLLCPVPALLCPVPTPSSPVARPC